MSREYSLCMSEGYLIGMATFSRWLFIDHLSRDCSFHNIMTDAGAETHTRLHSSELHQDLHLDQAVRSASFEDCSVVKAPDRGPNYFIDDLTSSLPGDPTSNIGEAAGIYSLDADPPEYINDSQHYNPFRLDVFLVGNMFRKEFLNVRQGPHPHVEAVSDN